MTSVVDTLTGYKATVVGLRNQIALCLSYIQGLDLAIPDNVKTLDLMTGYRIVMDMTIANLEKILQEYRMAHDLSETQEINFLRRGLKQIVNAEVAFDKFNSL